MLITQIMHIQFLSTPSARRATHEHFASLLYCRISIHALREEGDVKLAVHNPHKKDFYPRPPRGGRPVCAEVTSST